MTPQLAAFPIIQFSTPKPDQEGYLQWEDQLPSSANWSEQQQLHNPLSTGVFRIPPNLFNVTCSALMGLLPPHSYILTSEYIMHGSRLSAKPTPWTSSYSYVHSKHPSSNSSTYLSGKHFPLRRGEIYNLYYAVGHSIRVV